MGTTVQPTTRSAAHTRPRPGTAAAAIRRTTAIAVAGVARHAVHAVGHRGTSLPGLLAERIEPEVVHDLGAGLGPVVLVVGTNGKTTTVRLVARLLAASADSPPVTNRSGANLRQGVATAIVGAAHLDGRLGPDTVPAVFEVDEMVLESLVESLPVSAIVATNLFRDQLDRYGEVDTIVRRWHRALELAPREARFVYCADDPRLEALARSSPLAPVTFGLAPEGLTARLLAADPNATEADPVACPICDTPYEFAWRSIGHLGDFRCPLGHVSRRTPDVAATITDEQGLDRVRLDFSGAFGDLPAATHLPGISGAYDTAAAVAAATAVGVEPATAVRSLDGATAAFGRLEELTLGRWRIVLALAKNAASFTESAAIAGRLAPDSVLLGLNDEPADGRDVSWIWDIGLERLAGVAAIGLGGTRADDLAIRLKYEPRPDGRPWPVVASAPRVGVALRRLLARTPVDGTVVVLATYTALLGVRGWLEEHGAVARVRG